MYKTIAACAALVISSVAWGQASPIRAPGYKVEQLVKPSAFHGVHGLAFDAQDRLYAGSVAGQRIYRVDTATGKTEVVVDTPDGMADDLVFMPDGTLVWTSINQNLVRARKGDGPVRVIGEKLPGANSIAFRKSDGRLFMGQVFAGDGLWELDVTGAKPPRNILKDIGGLNGFDFGPDGWIYGPLWFKKQVVKINPDTGELKVVATGFHTPAAANFDSKWNLYVLDTALGTVNRVDIKSGAQSVVAQLETSLDNLAIDSRDRVFVSNMADNGIQEVDVKTGRARQVIKGQLATPVGLAAVSEGNSEKLYIADIFALRALDANTGKISDIQRSHAAGAYIEYPVGVTANYRHLISVQYDGAVLQFALPGAKFLREWKNLHATHAAELDDGALVVVTDNTLQRVGIDGKTSTIADDIGIVQGLAVADGNAYLSDVAGGRLVRVTIADGTKKIVASELNQPVGIAIDKTGNVLTLEFGKRRIVSVNPTNGRIGEIASNLPIGIYGKEQPGLPIGLAIGPSGAIFFASDLENAVYKLTKL